MFWRMFTSTMWTINRHHPSHWIQKYPFILLFTIVLHTTLTNSTMFAAGLVKMISSNRGCNALVYLGKTSNLAVYLLHRYTIVMSFRGKNDVKMKSLVLEFSRNENIASYKIFSLGQRLFRWVLSFRKPCLIKG